MLENWVWKKKTLEIMSGHYKDGSPIPRDLLDNLVASETGNQRIWIIRQLFFATVDFLIHTQDDVDIEQVAKDVYRDILGIERLNGTNIGTSIPHFANGYDASIYGYIRSYIFAQDMFYARFAVEGILNPETGMDYRMKILQPGGSIDGDEMIKNFLGRKPNQESFLKKML